jgi:hypothetical protein
MQFQDRVQKILHVVLVLDGNGTAASLAILETIDEERKPAAQRDDAPPRASQ